MKNFFYPLFTILILSFSAKAQKCNCPESFDWMKNNFEKNDAGFKFVLEKKGETEYIKHSALYKEKAKSITTLPECLTMMNDWLHYFRSGHLGVYTNVPLEYPNVTNKILNNDSIRLVYKNEKTIDLTEKQLISILDKKQNKNLVEGIWSNDRYTLGIISDEKSNKVFNAFVIKADSIYWMPKQIKAVFTVLDDNKTFSVDFLMRDHSKKTSQAKFVDNSGSLFFFMNEIWKKKYPKNEYSKKEKLLLLIPTAKQPFVEKISDKTIYLRIPSFEFEQKKYIDSVLAKNNELITSTPNLIIDIRNGKGGSDDSWAKLIPYYYTQPIRTEGMQYYATEQNAIGYENYTKQKTDTIRISQLYSIARKMRANLGTFITTSEEKFSIDSLHKALLFPQKIAIICNQANGSSDEAFLMNAKQSSKVKVFGRPTYGVLDFSNINTIVSPSGQFSLIYSMTKSFRIPNYCIDGIGIQPDYFIDDAILDYDWIEYTKNIIEQQK